MNRKRMKLRNKLMASYLIALIIPIIIISLTIYKLSSESLENAAEEFASMYTSQAMTTINDFVEEYDQVTQSLLVDSEILKFLSNDTNLTMERLIEGRAIIRRFLVRTITLKKEIESVVLISANNNVYQYARTNVIIDEQSLLNQDWLQHVRETGGAFFITPAHDRSYYNDRSAEAVVTVGRVLLNYNGSYAGMILLDMHPRDLIKLNEEFLLAGNRYDTRLIITNREGGILYHSDGTTGKRPWHEIVSEQYEIAERETLEDLIVLSDQSENGQLLLSVEIPIDTLLANNNKVKNVTLLSIALCIIFIALISFIFSHRITKPILQLRRSMKQAEIGHYVPIEPLNVVDDEVGGLVTSYNSMILKIKALIEDVYIAEIKQKQAKLLALQTQINPHMLYNTLESIRMKALVQGKDDIADMIKILARMFKLALRQEAEANTIRHEIEYVENYIKLQNIRYDDRFTLEVKLSESTLNSTIIPLIFQPIIENSIKHGFRGYHSYLNIVIEEKHLPDSSDDGDLLIWIADNGAGLGPKEVKEINDILQSAKLDQLSLEADDKYTEIGIGLKNIAERIKLHYGEQYYLLMKSEQNSGTIMELSIPRQQ